MNRNQMLRKIDLAGRRFDFIVIGGGASGAGVALEAASRGYSVVLFEKFDFAKSTSGKSTKLVHGGVRYLAQGNLGLVREACVERKIILRNAPHLVKDQMFIIPAYGWYDEFLYTIGLKFYDLLAGSYSLGKSKRISTKETLRRMPGIKPDKLTGGIVYHDGQFDDSRLALNVLQTAAGLGAVVINYMPVVSLVKNENGKICGVCVKDYFSGTEIMVDGKVVTNTTGVFADEIMQMDQPEKERFIKPSQGIHLILDKSFLMGNDALMIPKTDDGRVLFALPWHGKLVVGTTDTPVEAASPEPVALKEEIDFILETAGRYFKKAPGRNDVKSVFAGLRPLVAPSGDKKRTREISRSHKIIVSPSGLLTMIGGKWTTFRKMAEDMVSRVETVNKWKKTHSVSRGIHIHGYKKHVDYADPLNIYGVEKVDITRLVDEEPDFGEYLSESLGIIKAQVIWAVRNEMAMCVEDFLSRRTRCLLLDAAEAMRIAPVVAGIMAKEMGKDKEWEKAQVEVFLEMGRNYLCG